MRVNTLGKIAGAAAVADITLNGGEGVKKIAPACGCYAIFVLGVFLLPIAWIISKIFF
jgi:hypothetical protein